MKYQIQKENVDEYWIAIVELDYNTPEAAAKDFNDYVTKQISNQKHGHYRLVRIDIILDIRT